MSITHQDITEERDRAWSRYEKELDSLVELCGGLGHRFGEPTWTMSFHFDTGKRAEGLKRYCEVCGHDEWVSGEPAGKPLPEAA